MILRRVEVYEWILRRIDSLRMDFERNGRFKDEYWEDLKVWELIIYLPWKLDFEHAIQPYIFNLYSSSIHRLRVDPPPPLHLWELFGKLKCGTRIQRKH